MIILDLWPITWSSNLENEQRTKSLVNKNQIALDANKFYLIL